MYITCPTYSEIFQSSFQSSKLKLVGLFSYVKRALVLSFELFGNSFGKCQSKWDTSGCFTVFFHSY